MAATQRKRNGIAYEPAYHSRERVQVEYRTGRDTGTFMTFEPNGVRYADYHQTRPRVFVQWRAVTAAPDEVEEELGFTDADFEALHAPDEPASDHVVTREDRLNITRIDHPTHRTFGELVRIRRNGSTRSKFFSDRKHDGPAGALAAARAWRDEQLREVGHLVRERHPSIYLTRENNTEYVGVSWHDGTKKRDTRYSLTKHGDAAFALAASRPMRGETSGGRMDERGQAKRDTA